MVKNSNDKYAQDGVNINAGDAFSSFCGDICKSTYHNSRFVRVNDLSKANFRGPRGFNFKNLPTHSMLTMVVDGVGTKVIPIVASGKLETAASNVIAMTAMDITRYGGLPLVFMNIFDVRSLGGLDSKTYRMCKDAMLGLKVLADEHNYVLLGGETAELGVCVGSDNPNPELAFNWGGTMLGVYHPDKMIYGDTLKPGQTIIALRDDFRSNGISSVRKALQIHYGDNWYDNPDALDDIIAASTPSTQYDRLLNYAHGWTSNENEVSIEPFIPMHLIVHLSGGAFESKLGKDMLSPQGLSAELFNLFEPPEIMLKCASWRGLSDEECYSTWNGGQGSVVVVDDENVEKFLDLAGTFNVDARVAGVITEKKDYTVAIKSKFGSNQTIFY
ncbi:MAG: AIR synthase related protein [Parcubacteria group bacterium]